MIRLSQIRTNQFITYEFARSASTAVFILLSVKKQSISRIFNQLCLLGEKRRIPGFKCIRKCKGLKTLLKNSGFIPAEACGLQDDVILLCLVSSTTPRRRNLLAALAQCTVSHFRSSSTKRSLMYFGKPFDKVNLGQSSPVFCSCFIFLLISWITHLLRFDLRSSNCFVARARRYMQACRAIGSQIRHLPTRAKR